MTEKPEVDKNYIISSLLNQNGTLSYKLAEREAMLEQQNTELKAAYEKISKFEPKK